MEISIVTTNLYVFYTFIFIIGLISGSFINVFIYRFPRGESIVYPASHCTRCGSYLRFYHNIPVLSYIFLKGRCADCRSGISVLYPIVELLTAFLAVLIFHKFGFAVVTAVYMLLAFSLIAVTFTDLKYMIIPNVITLPGIMLGFLYNSLITDWSSLIEGIKYMDLSGIIYSAVQVPAVNSLVGIMVGGGSLFLIATVYKLIRKTEGMGMGDVKLLAMLGAFLGVKGVFFTLLVSSLIGSTVGLIVILMRMGNFQFALPYGPFLSLGAILFIFTEGFYFWF